MEIIILQKIDRSKSELELLKRNGKHQIERKKEREREITFNKSHTRTNLTGNFT